MLALKLLLAPQHDQCRLLDTAYKQTDMTLAAEKGRGGSGDASIRLAASL